jgi:hypothetical protein
MNNGSTGNSFSYFGRTRLQKATESVCRDIHIKCGLEHRRKAAKLLLMTTAYLERRFGKHSYGLRGPLSIDRIKN